MVECLVEFEYIAAEDDELTLKPGDVIANVQKHSGGWWEGDLNGKHGMFPDNFVKEMKKEAKEKSKDAPGAPGKKAGGHVAELANRLHKDGGIKIGLPGPRVIKRGGDANKRKLRAKVAYSYTPENEDEVALEVGDFVEILKQEEEGWWEGIVNGKQGVFPSNFVAVVDEDDVQSPPSSHSPPSAAAPQPPQDAPMGETVEIPGKKIRGIGLGNIFSDGPIQLRKTGSTRKQNEDIKPAAVEPKEKPETNAQPPKNSVKKNAPPSVPKELPVLPAKEHSQPRDMRDHKYSPKPTPTPAPQGKPVERAKVLFAYTAENEDELSIDEGDVIFILEKELEDSGWWRGELNGDVGVFPDNFVELLPPEEQIRPKKPPPPSISMNNSMKASRPLPPDPVKPSEPPKLQKTVPDVKEEKKVGGIGATAATKKPAVPPPVGKKPKPADPKLMAQTDDHKAKEVQKEQKSESSLDIVESTEKLSHPTRNRVRAPDRKPPSLRMANGLQPNEEVEEVAEHGSPQLNESRKGNPKSSAPQATEPPKEEKPREEPPTKPLVNSAPGSPRRDSHRDSRRGVTQRPDPPKEGPPPMEKEEKEKSVPSRAVRPPPPVLKDPVGASPASPPSSARHHPKPRTPSPVPDVSASSNDSNTAGQVAELEAKLAELRLTSVRKSEHEDLRAELASLHELVKGMKASFDRKLFELMTEIDEEKKVRLTMQVEMDRLKKMLSS